MSLIRSLFVRTMAKARNKQSVAGKKKSAASKSSKAKHAAPRKKQTKRVCTITPPPPPASIKLSEVFVVGGIPKSRTLLSKDPWNLEPYLNETLRKLIAEAPSSSRFYIYLSLEMLNNTEQVPVAIVIQCDCIPTTLLCKTSVQSVREEFFDMYDMGFQWKEMHERVSVLSCSTPLDNALSEYCHLYLPPPSELQKEQPEPVCSVQIQWQGKDLVWFVSGDETAQEAVESEFPDISDEDKAAAIARLEEQKAAQQELAVESVENKRRLFNEMVEREGMTLEALENRRVFKVYPNHPRLEPTTVAFGGGTFSQGFAKKKIVNRFIGNAETLF